VIRMRVIVELTKYILILLMGIYTYFAFNVYRYKSKRKQDIVYAFLSIIVFFVHFIGYATLYLQSGSIRLVFLYLGELIFFVLLLILYRILYPKMSRILMRNMMILLAIGFIILTRLSFDKAFRQVIFVGFASLLSLGIPLMIRKIDWFNKYGWLYGMIGVALLIIVLVAGTTYYGATNWLEIGKLKFQPSEFVKIVYVISIASLFQRNTEFKQVCLVTTLAAIHVLLLVFQKDLGGALIFFITYLFMLFSATNKPAYLFTGLAGGSLASYIAYHLFYHVRVRVMAWQNPFKYIDNEGYQVSQSLFAIGTGGWFGMGLKQGMPTDIPVVDSDFIFSAISEEFGGLFALCLILIYVNCFVALINIAMKNKDPFYRLTTLGFTIMFGFQVFLCIGGVIKFIPSTGVTLPLISLGGSSITATIFMFMIVQGIYMRSHDDMEVIRKGNDRYDIEKA